MVNVYVYYFSESQSRYFVNSSLEESSLGFGNGTTALDYATECQSSININCKPSDYKPDGSSLSEVLVLFSWILVFLLNRYGKHFYPAASIF